VDVLVLQHIACEPPGIHEDVLRERDVKITRVEVDEGERLPDRSFDAIVAMGVPAYRAYADRVLGPGALPQLLDDFEGRASELMDHGRRMFESWLDAAVGARP
jgi:hypothetical protein